MQVLDKAEFEFNLPSKHVSWLSTEILSLCESYSNRSPEDSSIDISKMKKYAGSSSSRNTYRQLSNAHFISPVQEEIADDEGNTCKYSYLPLRELCLKYLANKSLLSNLQSQQPTSHRPKTFSTILDSEISPRLSGKLILELYSDEVVIAPACSFVSKEQNYLQVYASFANLPIQYRTKQDDIETVLIVNRCKLNKVENPLPRLFAKLREDLYNLTTQGISLIINGECINIGVSLGAFCGDNKVFGILYFTCFIPFYF